MGDGLNNGVVSQLSLMIPSNEMTLDKKQSANRSKRHSDIDEILGKSVITDDYEQLHAVSPYFVSRRVAKKQRKEERSKTKGDGWFNMKAPEMTDETKRDLEILQMRSVLDSKRFYKKNDLKVLPKYFQMGRIQSNHEEFYSSRLPKRQQKRTFLEELMSDADFEKANKKKYALMVQEKQRKMQKLRKMQRAKTKKGKREQKASRKK